MIPYAELVEQAVSASFSGWDFAWLQGRAVSAELPWSYDELARAALQKATRVLDVDTGGGEVLASLAPLPQATIATEGRELPAANSCEGTVKALREQGFEISGFPRTGRSWPTTTATWSARGGSAVHP